MNIDLTEEQIEILDDLLLCKYKQLEVDQVEINNQIRYNLVFDIEKLKTKLISIQEYSNKIKAIRDLIDPDES